MIKRGPMLCWLVKLDGGVAWLQT